MRKGRPSRGPRLRRSRGADDNRPMFAYQGVKTEPTVSSPLDVEFYGATGS